MGNKRGRSWVLKVHERRMISMPRRARVAWGLALLLGLTNIVACSKGTAPPEGTPIETPGDPAVVQLLKDPAPVGDFTLTDLQGRTLSSADLRGKVVLVNFWAT